MKISLAIASAAVVSAQYSYAPQYGYAPQGYYGRPAANPYYPSYGRASPVTVNPYSTGYGRASPVTVNPYSTGYGRAPVYAPRPVVAPAPKNTAYSGLVPLLAMANGNILNDGNSNALFLSSIADPASQFDANSSPMSFLPLLSLHHQAGAVGEYGANWEQNVLLQSMMITSNDQHMGDYLPLLLLGSGHELYPQNTGEDNVLQLLSFGQNNGYGLANVFGYYSGGTDSVLTQLMMSEGPGGYSGLTGKAGQYDFGEWDLLSRMGGNPMQQMMGGGLASLML